MRNSAQMRGVSLGNPIANALVIVVGIVAIAAAIVLGFFAFLILGAIVSILAAVIGIRLWWFNRKVVRAHARKGSGEGAKSGSNVIEGEYRVLDRDTDGP